MNTPTQLQISNSHHQDFKKKNNLLEHEVTLLESDIERKNKIILAQKVNETVLKQKLREKGLNETGYAFLYYVLNAIIGAVFISGIKTVSFKSSYPNIVQAAVWIAFIVIFFPLLTTIICYYSRYFIVSKSIIDIDYAKINDKEHLYEVNDEAYFPCYKEEVQCKNVPVFTFVKNWFKNMIMPETLSIRITSWAAQFIIIGCFSFAQYMCSQGSAHLFKDLESTERLVANVILNLFTAVILCMMFVMIRHVIDKLCWGKYSTSEKLKIIDTVQSSSINDPVIDCISNNHTSKEKIS